MKKYIIELIGTFFLVLIIGLTENPIAIGLGLAVLVYMGAHISGAHYNPVVTLAMYINDQIDLKESGKYIASQLTGSVVAVYTMIGLGQDSFSVVSKTTEIQSFFVAEILFTFLLVFVILNVALNESLKGNQFYGLAIGLTVTAGAFSVGDISGAVFNPAVSFGPSLLSFIDPQVIGSNVSSSDFFVYFLIREVHIWIFWMCLRGSSVCVCLGAAHAAPLCVPWEGSCTLPRIHFCFFLITKLHILIFWMCLRGSSVCARGGLMRLLCVCLGRAHAPFPDFFCLFSN